VDPDKIISPIRRSSRRIEQPGLRQHRLTQPIVQRPAGNEIDWSPQDRRKLVGEVFDFPAQPSAGCQVIEHVDVAVRALLTAADRAEDLEARHAVASADLCDSIEVDLKPSEAHDTTLRHPLADRLPAPYRDQTLLPRHRRPGRPQVHRR
jgi:hypothetical protein